MSEEQNELMSVETGLTSASPEALGMLLADQTSKYADETALSKVTKVGDWLPYVALMGGNSLEVKRGEFPIGHFCLKKNKKMIDLGKEFIMYLLSWRPKAMMFEPKVLSYFDTESEDFKKIVARADSTKNPGCGYGPEYLIWLPEVKEFATYFLSSKTGRNESPNIQAILKTTRLCKQKSHLIETEKYSWHGPTTLACDLEIPLPPIELAKQELDKFNNPPAAVEEVAEEAESDSRS